MKISKSLLQSMLVGVALGTTTTACEHLINPIGAIDRGHTDSCDEGCKVNHHTAEPNWEDCPGCGLG